uniref:Dolichyl-diphosphooligosaccharide--protein glycosyltransferase subunit 1 n=2 Tax=Panagrellus redivivus TaxID=6233 RepID=A0A7E4VS43_PANRE
MKASSLRNTVDGCIRRYCRIIIAFSLLIYFIFALLTPFTMTTTRIPPQISQDEYHFYAQTNSHRENAPTCQSYRKGRIAKWPFELEKMLRVIIPLLLIGAAWTNELVPSSKLVATRNVDISTQLAKFSVNLEVKNGGPEATYFVYALTKTDNDHLSYLVASDSANKKLPVAPIKYAAAKPGFEYYKINFGSPLASGASHKVKIEYVLTGALKAYPAQISQEENQFMLFNTNDAIVSPYTVESDTTTITTGGKIISSTDGKQTTSKVTYTNTNLAPYTTKPVSVHYENNSPFVVVTSLERTIEISHWGNVAIEDHIEIVHKGAELKGAFSRLDYQVDRRTKSPIVKVLKATLPAKSRDIYYRDQIGNISTSTVRNFKDRVEVEMRPRFPLLGGWRTNYILGISPLFNDLVVESAKIKIILPETAQ